MAKKGKSQRAMFDRGMPVTRITMKERKKLTNEIERTYTSLRKEYAEIHGKTVDFEQQSVSEGILYVGIRFPIRPRLILTLGIARRSTRPSLGILLPTRSSVRPFEAAKKQQFYHPN